MKSVETRRLGNDLSCWPDLIVLNTILMVFDSLPFSTAVNAHTPEIDALLGPPFRAITLSPYTPAAHTAMFLGHLPSDPTSSLPYSNETIRQPFRITTGPSRDAGKGCGILLEGNNIIEGFGRKGFHVPGFGGVSQFSQGSLLRENFPWSQFTYFGPDMDEEPLKPREPHTFPLNHIDEMVASVRDHEHWIQFANNPEPHYPYDSGKGIPGTIQQEAFPILKKGLNLRSHNLSSEDQEALAPHAKALRQLQTESFSDVDSKIGILIRSLAEITAHPLLVIMCGDHGEHFGENGLWGHMHPTKECLTVPLWINVVLPNI